MIEYARDLKARGVEDRRRPGTGPADPRREELLTALDGAAVYIVNDYEWELTREKTGLDEDAIAERVGALVVTRGEDGSIVRRGGLDAGLEIESRPDRGRAGRGRAVVDPTGCGDSYRAGLLYALAGGHLARGRRATRQPDGIAQGRTIRAAEHRTRPGIDEHYQKEFGESL